MEFKNLRPYTVELPALGVSVEPGGVFEATGEVADGLVKQTDNFERTDKPADKKEK